MEGEADYDCGEFHVGRLGANLSSVFKGEEDGAFLLLGGALGDYGDPSSAFAVGGVALFLEYAEEVVAFKFPLLRSFVRLEVWWIVGGGWGSVG